MKVHANPLPPAARDFARPGAAGGSGKPFADAVAATAGDGGELPAAPAAAKSADARGPKDVPPGLEKVQARLQELAGERTRGQEKALGSISANIARYMEQHALAAPVPPPAEAVPEGSDPVAPPLAGTPAETATPDAPTAEVPAAPDPTTGIVTTA